MNLLKADFEELYERHLCRHSQFGVNLNHLIAVLGIYYALCSIAFILTGSGMVVAALLAPYLAILAFNLPLRVLIACALVVAALAAGAVWLPRLPIWGYPILIVLMHYLQQWGHKVYRAERDMSQFREKYPKGPRLFILLSVYELPILLNYLVFDRASWAR